MIRFLSLLGVATWLCVSAAAQAPADFSGRWTVPPPPAPPSGSPPPAARGDMGSGWGTTFVITQDAKQLVVECQVYSRNDLQPQPRFTYALDGSETRNTLMMGRGFQPQTSRARWEAQSLAITTTHTLEDPVSKKPLTFDLVQKITLESPTTLVVEVSRPAILGGRASTTRAVYTKG